MRQVHCSSSPGSLTPARVHAEARAALERVLPWKAFGKSVTVADLLDLLLQMAVSTASLFATVRRFFSFSHETASKAVRANLPSCDKLVEGLLKGLYETADFSRQDRRRRWLLAIDTHDVPYYGKKNASLVGGPKKQGTRWFYAYASAVLLHQGRRYTIALCPLAPKTKPHEIVRMLLDQIAEKGLKIKGVVLDSGFDSGETFLLLQERAVAYTVPLRRKGNTNNARNRLFEGRDKQVRWMSWYVKNTRRKVETRTVLWKGSKRTMLLAFGGWSCKKADSVHRQADQQKTLYRRRFGIETSYRQKNQAQAKTTSSDPVYRLLLEGLGYLIRQLWVVLTEKLSRSQGRTSPKTFAWVSELPLRRLTEWLFGELGRLHPEECSIPLA